MTPQWITNPGMRPDYRGPVNRPYPPFADPNTEPSMLDRLRQVVERDPAKVAFDDCAAHTSYGTLWQMIGQISAAISAHPVIEGPIGLLLPSSAAYVAGLFACLAAGRVCVLLDVNDPPDRIATICAVTGAALVLRSHQGVVPPASVAGLLIDDACRNDTAPIISSGAGLGLNEPAFIICTSGSTGLPKALVHSQMTMLVRIAFAIEAHHIAPSDHAVMTLSYASIGSSWLLATVMQGATMHSFDLRAQGFSGLLKVLSDKDITIMAAGMSIMRNLIRLPRVIQSLRTLRLLFLSGEPTLKADLALLWEHLPESCYIHTAYGSTEINGFTWFAGEQDDHDPSLVTGGYLRPGVEAMIIDDSRDVCPPGVAGELILRSYHSALGEWEGGRLVPGRLQPDPADPRYRIYHTGDIARYREDGVFVALGRKDRMLKINGQRVEPAEIETVLGRMPEVAEAVGIARQSDTRTTLVAFVIPATNQASPPAQLREQLRSLLPASMIPARIRMVTAVPLLPGGKRDEAALMALDAQMMATAG